MVGTHRLWRSVSGGQLSPSPQGSRDLPLPPPLCTHNLQSPDCRALSRRWAHIARAWPARPPQL